MARRVRRDSRIWYFQSYSRGPKWLVSQPKAAWSVRQPVLDLILSPLAILAGCGLLYFGGDMLVSASTFIADRIGMSPIAIGATIVAIGTSAPELSVSLDAALSGHVDVSVGNIVGSNVCNIILVLGLCGLVSQLRPSREVVRIDFPILIVVSGIFAWVISDQIITRTEGVALVAGLVVYVVWNLHRAAEVSEIEEILLEEVAEALSENSQNWAGPAVRALGGIFCLGLGATWLVRGSLQALEPFHLSEAAIGITIVALGTSVPEIGTSIIAARKGHGDLAVGNAIGSSVFNLLGVLGVTACIKPLIAYDVTVIDGFILIAASLVGLVLVARPNGIGRVQGVVLVTAYTLYVATAVAYQS
jgi:cation:H+ antiporter